MITVKYFGVIAEKTKCTEEIYTIDAIGIDEFISEINKKHQLNVDSYSIAVNQKIIDIKKSSKLTTNDEVAFLPPFAGG
jgi:sulfur-carrier protein